MLKILRLSNLGSNIITRSLGVSSRRIRALSTSTTPAENETGAQKFQHPSRPASLADEKLTDVVESKEDFEKYVTKILPNYMVPDPPLHDSYPTPSGWVPPNLERAARLPYFVLRTRFHQFPIYPEERDGSKRYVRIKNIEGDIWVCVFNQFFFVVID